MPEQITLEKALELVSFHQSGDGTWHVKDVKGRVWGSVGGSIARTIYGNVGGDVHGHVDGSVYSTIYGNVGGSVYGAVCGTIAGREWQFVETPKEKLRRLIEEDGTNEMIELFNQLEDN